MNQLLLKVLFVIPSILIAFVVHEICHAYVAYLFGDPTAKYEGRFSLDPRKHIDPFGALLIIVLILISPVVFGWAKPVSVNPNNFRSPRKDMAWVAFAGPLSNFTMAALAGLLLKFQIFPLEYDLGRFYPIFEFTPGTFIWIFVATNVGLGIFNMIPIPPLDGSKILYGILPSDLAYRLMDMEMRYAQMLPIILVVLIVSGILKPIIESPYIFLVTLFS